VRWTVVTNCDSFFITKCDTVYYKLRQVLQSAMDLSQIATGITKCDDITNCDSTHCTKNDISSFHVHHSCYKYNKIHNGLNVSGHSILDLSLPHVVLSIMIPVATPITLTQNQLRGSASFKSERGNSLTKATRKNC